MPPKKGKGRGPELRHEGGAACLECAVENSRLTEQQTPPGGGAA